MPICAEIGAGNAILATTEVYPQCAELAVFGAADIQKITFWADLSIMLEPGQPGAWEFYAATLMVFIAAWGAKQVARLILNR